MSTIAALPKMPHTAIPKIQVEYHMPKPEKRHFVDYFAKDQERKLIQADMDPKTQQTAYRIEYKDAKDIPISVTQFPRVYRKSQEPPVPALPDLKYCEQEIQKHGLPRPSIRDADTVLYHTTYQEAFVPEARNDTKHSKYHYFDDAPLKGVKPHQASLYRQSFKNTSTESKRFNTEAGHKFTKLLYQKDTTGVPITELLYGKEKLKDTTTYHFDYMPRTAFKPDGALEYRAAKTPNQLDRIRLERYLRK